MFGFQTEFWLWLDLDGRGVKRTWKSSVHGAGYVKLLHTAAIDTVAIMVASPCQRYCVDQQGRKPGTHNFQAESKEPGTRIDARKIAVCSAIVTPADDLP